MIQYKTFLLSKHDDVELTQDWLESDPQAGRFAVADGVSNSYHPEMLSKALCRAFTALGDIDFDNWERFAAKSMLPPAAEEWSQTVENYRGTLAGRELRHEDMRRERFTYGASTFIGLDLDLEADLARFAVIGDSTLFALIGGGYRSWCTSPKLPDDSGVEKIDFSTSTNAVESDGALAGRWLTGSFALGKGYIVLLTDAMAKWFQMMHFRGEHPEEILWGLRSNADFEALAERWRAEGEMDDDLAVTIIKLTPRFTVIEKIEAEEPEEVTEYLDTSEPEARLLPALPFFATFKKIFKL